MSTQDKINAILAAIQVPANVQILVANMVVAQITNSVNNLTDPQLNEIMQFLGISNG